MCGTKFGIFVYSLEMAIADIDSPTPRTPEEVFSDLAEQYGRALPSISVLVPSYQQGRFLEQCLQSLLSQEYPKLEILVADGGSTDESRPILERYTGQLTWWVSELDRGTWDANNKALARATGEFVLVVNSDDYLLPGGLLELIKLYMQAPEAGWYTAPVQAVNQSGEVKAVFTPQILAKRAGLTLLEQCWLYHPATLVRREWMGAFAQTDVLDWEMWLRLEMVGHLPVLGTVPVAALRFHDSCKSYDTAAMGSSHLALLERLKTFPYFTGQPGRLAELQTVAEQVRTNQRYARLERTASEQGAEAGYAAGLREALHHPGLLASRRFWGYMRRVPQGFEEASYNPMAFLDAK